MSAVEMGQGILRSLRQPLNEARFREPELRLLLSGWRGAATRTGITREDTSYALVTLSLEQATRAQIILQYHAPACLMT